MFFDLDDVFLRELRKSDLEGNWYKWFNDFEVTKYQDKRIFPNSIEKQIDYYEYLKKSKSDIVFAIVDKQSGIHIGNIGVHNIDYIHRRCEIGIVIGEKEFKGRKIGKRCINQVKKYIFDTLNLMRITVFIMHKNLPSIKSFENCGFVKEGVIKKYYYKNGEYLDCVIYGLIK